MKLIASLIFILSAPIVVFLATLLYGGVSTQAIKQELAQNNLYQALSDTIISGLTETEDGSEPDPTLASLQPILQNRFSKDYLQNKSETFIDDAKNYVKGESQTVPVLSFKEIKEDIIYQNPQLLTQLQEGFNEFKKESMSEEATQNMTEEEKKSLASFQKSDPVGTFVKNDFSVPVGDGLKGLRQTYQTLSIVLPVFIIMMLGSLGIILLKAQTLKSKLRWIGITLLITAVGGGLLLIINSAIKLSLEAALADQKGEIASIIKPFLSSILGLFFDKYRSLQTTATSVFGVTGAILLIISFLTKNQASVSTTKIPTKKSTNNRSNK